MSSFLLLPKLVIRSFTFALAVIVTHALVLSHTSVFSYRTFIRTSILSVLLSFLCSFALSLSRLECFLYTHLCSVSVPNVNFAPIFNA